MAGLTASGETADPMMSSSHLPPLDVQVVRTPAPVVRAPVPLAKDDLQAAVDVRGQAFDQRHFAQDRLAVLQGEARGAVRPGADAAGRPGARLDPDEVVA